jgi:1-acyl-sn-glycerol-3-phosphate acyltransferase
VSSSTSARPSLGRDLPRTDDVSHPPRYLLHNPVLRALARRLITRRWDLHVTGAEHLPSHGPAIVAANHIGWLDGPLLGIVLPRPVHALTKLDMFTGRTGAFLQRTGQIPVDRFHPDPHAVKTALRVLRDGDVVGVFPEGTRGDGELRRIHRGAAYFALASGAPVVPVVFLGTRLPSGGTDSRPPTGSRIDVVVGRGVEVAAQPWPRTREQVEGLSRLLHERLLENLDAARAATGRDLPGPLPADEREPDPATAINDEPTGSSRTEEHDD